MRLVQTVGANFARISFCDEASSSVAKLALERHRARRVSGKFLVLAARTLVTSRNGAHVLATGAAIFALDAGSIVLVLICPVRTGGTYSHSVGKLASCRAEFALRTGKIMPLLKLAGGATRAV